MTKRRMFLYSLAVAGIGSIVAFGLITIALTLSLWPALLVLTLLCAGLWLAESFVS